MTLTVATLQVAGLDWAAQPRDRALVGLSFDASTGMTAVTSVDTRVKDEAVVRAIREGGYSSIGVDVPFGWPAGFLDFVQRWSCTEPLPGLAGLEHEDFAFRRTDRLVRRLKQPLSVSADRIALATRTWVGLVARYGLQPHVDVHAARPPIRPNLIEVYPGATLAVLTTSDGVTTKDYKKSPEVRAALLDRLQAIFHLESTPELRTALVGKGKHAHATDALVAALTTLMYEGVLNRPIRRPETDDERRDALREGWMMVPNVPPAGQPGAGGKQGRSGAREGR